MRAEGEQARGIACSKGCLKELFSAVVEGHGKDLSRNASSTSHRSLVNALLMCVC